MISFSNLRRCILVWFFAVAVAVILLAEPASACITLTEKPEELKRQAQVVVQALLLQAEGSPRQSFMSTVYSYNVIIESVELGSLSIGPSLLTYEDLHMHRRGNLTVCPLNHGSGIEQALKPNTHYRLYLRSETDLEILLAEELPSPSSATPSSNLNFLGTSKE